MKTKKQKQNELLVSEFLKLCRIRAGLSQQAVADKLGCSKQYVSNWERGTCLPAAVRIPSINRIYGLEKNELALQIIDAKTLDLRATLN